jgi:hypothetical protein
MVLRVVEDVARRAGDGDQLQASRGVGYMPPLPLKYCGAGGGAAGVRTLLGGDQVVWSPSPFR